MYVAIEILVLINQGRQTIVVYWRGWSGHKRYDFVF